MPIRSVRKSERLLNLIVMLLETSRPVTAEQIRRTIPGYGHAQWEAFKRMFERDKDELREMGIPLEVSDGDFEDTEVYRIPKDRYYLPDLGLAPDEVAALWLAAGLVKMKDPSTARTALMKISDEEPVAPAAQFTTADLALSAPNLAKAYECVVQRRRVAFKYSSRGVERTRSVRPYGLVHRKGAWYLAGHDEDAGAVRSFRLDRIKGGLRPVDSATHGHQFDVPEDFRPEAALELPPFAQGEKAVTAEVRFEASSAWWVERSNPWLRLEFEEGGGASAQVDVADTGGFISWVLSFGEGAEIVAPQELRDAIRGRLEEICERY